MPPKNWMKYKKLLTIIERADVMIITEIFAKVFNMSLAAAVVILAVILLRIILKRAPKIFSYLLWTAVIFRLLCPFTLVLPFAPLRSDMVSFENFRNADTIEIPQAADITEQITETAETTNYTNENIFPTENIIEEIPDDTEIPEKEEKPFTFDMLLCASIVWLFGVIAMTLWGMISYVRLEKNLKNSECLRENIYITKAVNNAFIMGFFRTKIFIPADISEKEREFIIIHEKTHLRRGDHLAKLIMYIALCVHWFDPLVWLSFALFEKDMEMSCDEAAAKNFSREEKADYSQALLNVSAKRAAAFTACFGESGAKSRIKNILSFKKPAVWVIILCAVIAAISVVFLVTDRAKTLPDERLETTENTEFTRETQTREQPENIEFTEMQIQLPDEVTSIPEKITGFDYSYFTENSSDNIQLIAADENYIYLQKTTYTGAQTASYLFYKFNFKTGEIIPFDGQVDNCNYSSGVYAIANGKIHNETAFAYRQHYAVDMENNRVDVVRSVAEKDETERRSLSDIYPVNSEYYADVWRSMNNSEYTWHIILYNSNEYGTEIFTRTENTDIESICYAVNNEKIYECCQDKSKKEVILNIYDLNGENLNSYALLKTDNVRKINAFGDRLAVETDTGILYICNLYTGSVRKLNGCSYVSTHTSVSGNSGEQILSSENGIFSIDYNGNIQKIADNKDYRLRSYITDGINFFYIDGNYELYKISLYENAVTTPAENETPSENIQLSAPEYEYKNSVYFGSEFPVILYANEKYCVFKDGFDGIYIYNFDYEELVFEAILSEDISFIGAASDNDLPVLYFSKNNSVYCLNSEENRLEKIPDGPVNLPMLKGVVYMPEINVNAVLIDGSENDYVYWETSGYAGVHSIKLIKHTDSGEREFIPIKMVYHSADIQFLFLEYGGGKFRIYNPLSSNTNDHQNGTYKYADGENAIIFTAENGDIFKFVIKGNSLIYDENGSAQTRWDSDDPFGTLTDKMEFIEP